MQRRSALISLSAMPVSFKDTVPFFKNQSNQGIMKTCLSFWYSTNNNKLFYFKGFVILWLLSIISPLSAQNLVLSSSQTITGAATYDNVTIQSGGALTVDGILTVNQNMTVESGGVVTHSPHQLTGLTLNVSGTLEILVGGKIDVTGRGLLGVASNNVYLETYDSLGNIVNGNITSFCVAGGSYGGYGGNRSCGGVSTPPYGKIENPNELGSAGAGNEDAGGLIKINATIFILNGAVICDGQGFNNPIIGQGGNGSSGGGIKIVVNAFSGGGTISSNGGNSQPDAGAGGGAGGGGRIAVYYSQSTFDFNRITAKGGTPNNPNTYPGSASFPGSSAGAGTIYLKKESDSDGILIVDNAGNIAGRPTLLQTNKTAFQSIIVQSGANFQLINTLNNVTVENSVIVRSKATAKLNNNFTLNSQNTTGFDIEVSSKGVLIFDSLAILGTGVNAIKVDSATLESATNLSFTNANDFKLVSNGNLKIHKPGIFSIDQFDENNVQSGIVQLDQNARIDITSNQMILAQNVTFIKDGKLGVNDTIGQLTVNGLITHSVRFLNGLTLHCGNLTINNTGRIDATGKGLLGVAVNGVYLETYDSLGNIVNGNLTNFCVAGGSYGGNGGNRICGGVSTPPYGKIENPNELGSASGGLLNGGGLIKINTETFTLNGAVICDGQGFNNPVIGQGVNGCAGGGIKIITNSFYGSGTITSNGGNALPDPGSGSWGGAGSGGRIAIYYNQSTFDFNRIKASGGTANNPPNYTGTATYPASNAAAGTIYLKSASDAEGVVIIENSGFQTPTPTFLKTNRPTFKSVNVKAGGYLLVNDNVNPVIFQQPFFVELDSAVCRFDVGVALVKMDSFHRLRSGSFEISERTTLRLASNTIHIENKVAFVKEGKFNPNDSLTIITIDSGAIITHSIGYTKGLKLKADQISINPGGAIDVTGKGLRGGNNGSQYGIIGEAYSEAGNTIISGSGGGSGGSYGGLGEISPTNPGPLNLVYGDKYFPNLFGSGGGGNGTPQERGGNGGGKLSIRSRLLTVNGKISSNGGNAPVHVGGGSGGSVLIFTDTITGTGSVEAKGGTGGCGSCGGGSGGGGRIAIYTHADILPISNITTVPGIPNFGSPQPGTIIYQNCGFENNVGVDTILSPQPGVSSPGTTIMPTIVVQNLSPGNIVFPVTFDIGSIYHDESYVNLAFGQKDTVQFSSYTTTLPGTIIAIAQTNQPGDNCTETNQKTINIAVNSGASPVITAVTPSSGGNTGASTLRITGQNFKPGISARLQKPGGGMIVAHYIDYKDSTEIFSSVNLQGAVLGMYDVIVQNPDFQSSTFQNGFEVQTGSIGWEGFAQPGCLSGNFDPGQLLELELQLPENVRVNRVFPVILRYHNIGNIDIPLPTRVLTCELELGYIGFTPQSAVEDSLQSLTLELREDGGPDNILRAGASGEITVYAISKKELTNVVPTHMIMFKLLE